MLSLKKNFSNSIIISVVENITFGAWLKAERESAGLTQKQLAQKAGYVCTDAYISHLERAETGKKGRPTQPDFTIVDALANALNVPISVARERAGYASPPASEDSQESSALSEFSIIISNYQRLSPEYRGMARRLINGTINTLSEIERENYSGDISNGAANLPGYLKKNIDADGSEEFIRETPDEVREKSRELKESDGLDEDFEE